MTLKVPDVGEPFLLDALRTYLNGCKIMLITNVAYTPTNATVFGDLVEATFPGYARQNTTNWGVSVETANKAVTQDDLHLWTRSTTGTAQTVTGYAVLDAANNLLWVEVAGTGVTLTNAGDPYAVIPRLTLNSEF